MLRIERLALLTTIPLLSAASAPDADAGPEAVAGPVVEARLRPLACTYEAGEVPRLTVETRNLSARLLRVPRCPTLLTLEVDGETFHPRGPSAAPYVAGLGAGERSDPTDLPVELFRPGAGWVDLAPGKHTVRVRLEADILGEGRTVEAWTNPVVVEVLARPSDMAATASPAEREAAARRAIASRAGRSRPKLGIYLVTGPCDLRWPADLDLQKLQLGDVPLLSEEDIVSWDWATHAIELTPRAFARLPSPGVWGLPFVVVAGSERCYLGAFWTHLSSYLPGIPICYAGPMASLDPEGKARAAIRIEPPPAPGGPPDPRGDERVRKALGPRRVR